jgi:hypothetical protein
MNGTENQFLIILKANKMKPWVELIDEDGRKILVQIDKIKFIKENENKSGSIWFDANNSVTLKHSYSELLSLLVISIENSESLKQQKFQVGAWTKVVDLAKQHAMMKLHGTYMECGSLVKISGSDRASYLSRIGDNLLRASEDAFLEDALTGSMKL